MASANALMHHRRLQRFKKSSHSEQPEVNNTAGGSTEVRIVPAEESSDSGQLKSFSILRAVGTCLQVGGGAKRRNFKQKPLF